VNDWSLWFLVTVLVRHFNLSFKIKTVSKLWLALVRSLSLLDEFEFVNSLSHRGYMILGLDCTCDEGGEWHGVKTHLFTSRDPPTQHSNGLQWPKISKNIQWRYEARLEDKTIQFRKI
jgi:hypothetical protein